MTTRLTRGALCVGTLCAIWCSTGCASAWERYEGSVYASLKYPGPDVYREHCELLSEMIAGAEKKERKPPPGFCAEYAFYLARLGRLEESRTYLAKEKEYYPESTRFVGALERLVEGSTTLLAPDDQTADAN